mgnify:CR=1 FL=1
MQLAAYSHWEMLEFDSRAGRQSALREPSLVTGVQGAAKAKIRQVQGQALDELAGEHSVTLINMDVEGAERLALQGCRQVITRLPAQRGPVCAAAADCSDPSRLPLLPAALPIHSRVGRKPLLRVDSFGAVPPAEKSDKRQNIPSLY